MLENNLYIQHIIYSNITTALSPTFAIALGSLIICVYSTREKSKFHKIILSYGKGTECREKGIVHVNNSLTTLSMYECDYALNFNFKG